MVNPTARIPKALLPALSKAADERGVKPSVLVAQAVRFYLSSTDPDLIARVVADAIKPIASDVRHIRAEIDKAVGASEHEKPASPKRAETIEQLVAEQVAKEAERQQKHREHNTADREERHRMERAESERNLKEALARIDANTPHKPSTNSPKGGHR